ncbi:MAG: sel1 repeat family protein [Candidatus Marithrix sp.]|nr:sel1 repeat family protein [Candidatus Marithrix sp.]
MKELSVDEDLSLSSGISAFESKHFPIAYDLLLPLAEAGHPDAQYRLAIMAQAGLGMVVNKNSAVKWMQASAKQGFGVAQHGLGFMYMDGDCVEQDYRQAVHWFKLAAEQGLAGAQVTLGNLYKEGQGVEQDLEEAKRWFAMAGF